MKIKNLKIKIIFCILIFFFTLSGYAQDIKEPNVAGTFYPEDPQELSEMLDTFFAQANPQRIDGQILVLISPHAGYEFCGGVAGYGYKLIEGKPYKTVVIIGTSHYHRFKGISVFTKGSFKTPLGIVPVDEEFTKKLLDQSKGINFAPEVFLEEHSIEVQIPFLQKVLGNFSATKNGGPASATKIGGYANIFGVNYYGWKIVPILIGEADFKNCRDLADVLISAIGDRNDVLIIASTDMYHGFDYQEAEIIDNLTLSYLKEMNPDIIYNKLISGTIQLCGGFGVVTAILAAKELNYNKLEVLKYTNSAEVTGQKIRGIRTVGYFSGVITKPSISSQKQEKGEGMLDNEQRKKLLKLARQSIEHYLTTGKKLEVFETDPAFIEKSGAFVTLHKRGKFQGCIGNYGGVQPLYLTVRDMAVEAAVNDPRSLPLRPSEIKDLEIEISVLSPLKKVSSADDVILGTHGVNIKRGFRSGVYLPQVARETGWTKEEFLSRLCAEKAGLPSDAWKDKDTEIYVFTAEVFSEKDY